MPSIAEIVQHPGAYGFGLNVSNEAGRMIPVLDGKTGAPLDLSVEMRSLHSTDEAQAMIDRIAFACDAASPANPHASARPRPHPKQGEYFRW